MIYRKDANFPYPLITDRDDSGYNDLYFTIDVGLEENSEDYRFEVEREIESSFIEKQLEEGKAELIFIIQAKDNKFFNMDSNDRFVSIPKSRLSLSKRTSIQVIIKSKEDISFEYNDDLNEFYNSFKKDIIVPKNSILGFSNILTFDGSVEKPLELFEKKIDPSLKSDIEICLSTETIIIKYKNDSFQFSDSPQSKTLNNTYVYMGLQKALYKFIVDNGEDGSVDLDSIAPPENGLDLKLYSLMKKKMIDEVSFENIDSVIYLISDRIIEKFMNTVRGLYK